MTLLFIAAPAAAQGRAVLGSPSARSVRAQASPVAIYVGARALAWPVANATIGPLHTQKIFYPPSQSLPAKWPGDNYGLTAGSEAIIAYKVPTTNVASFVQSVPSNYQVTMVYWQEPEAHLSPSTFISQFEQQANLIHARGKWNIKVAHDASAYPYRQSGSAAYNCAFIPAPQYVDYYYVDAYEQQDQGAANSPGLQRWMSCTRGLHRARGFAEYGLGNCQGNAARAQTMASDATWIRQQFPHLQTLNYWWVSDPVGASRTPCNTTWRFTDPQTITTWRSDFIGTSTLASAQGTVKAGRPWGHLRRR